MTVVCIDCGKPRTDTSGQRCRACYVASAAKARALRDHNANTGYAGPDHLSEDGARKLAERLTAYWDQRGPGTHRFWVETCHTYSGHWIFCVRSNLVRGLPPDETDERAA
ncbi:hypothetical protein LCGC14_2722660 [marine sediment metagenome]|uniref:Uncharacterized protein n=1 Tax=marine sediment metagenome TaxID=412755 RepID=A0A0F9BIT3_9ZZZZ